MRSLRTILGTLLYDWPRLAMTFIQPADWVLMRNRNDEVHLSPDRSGVLCNWVDTRPLHLCNIFPATSKWLLRRALQCRPIRLQEAPDYIGDDKVCRNSDAEEDARPAVSFLIGHRGAERLPLLLATLRSIAAQQTISFECIVVEQDNEPLIRPELPGWVRYIHQPLPESNSFYNRSGTFNAAASAARGDVLILHDNDMLVPKGYAAAAFQHMKDGYDVVQLKRFVFYLTNVSSERIAQFSEISTNTDSEHVVENLCGGGSVAISARAYNAIGGMDEEFFGWGGEDQEFWDRCQTLNVWGYGSFPIIHLWHEAQAGKRMVSGQGTHTVELTERRRAIPPEDRIAELVERQKGGGQ